MDPSFLLSERERRLCYVKVEARAVDRDMMVIESHLKRLGNFKIEPLKGLENLGELPCDLVIVGAQRVKDEHFIDWFSAFRTRCIGLGSIWTPALFIADVSFDVLRDFLLEAVKDNWYFDIVSPTQLSSLPIRVANLLRIHDHLHELKRYAAALEDIQAQVRSLEHQVGVLNKNFIRPDS